MSGQAPLWVTILVALMTGFFALAGHAFSSYQARKSQAQLFAAQQEAAWRERRAARLEEFFGTFTELFDDAHEAVVRYDAYKHGLRDAKSVEDSITRAKDKPYKRFTVLLGLYYSHFYPEFDRCIEPLVKCLNALAAWKLDKNKPPPAGFDEDWDKAMQAHLELKEKLVGLAAQMETLPG